MTKYRDEYDHSSELDVVVQFPAVAQLMPGEQESFEINMTGDEAQPAATFETTQSIYGYSVVDQKLSGRTYLIKLGLVAKYSADQLGAKTITGLTLAFANGTAQVRFADRGQMPRVASQYNVQILQAGSLVAEARGASVGGASSQVAQSLPVSATQLTNWDILDVGSQSGIYFMDHTPYNNLVATTYKVTLQARVGGALQMIGTATLDRSSVKVNSEGLSQILLVRDMKLPVEVASRLVTRSAEIQVDVEISRQSSRLNHGQPVILKKTFVDRNRD